MRFSLLVLLLLVLSVPPTRAQGSFGIGGQIGDPTGLTMKFDAGRSAIDLAAGWDLNDYLYLQGHLLLAERRFAGSEAGFFYGPGLFAGIAEGDRKDAFGFSFNAGVNYYAGPVELFGQLTPRLQLVDETDFDLGGALGLRFYP